MSTHGVHAGRYSGKAKLTEAQARRLRALWKPDHGSALVNGGRSHFLLVLELILETTRRAGSPPKLPGGTLVFAYEEAPPGAGTDLGGGKRFFDRRAWTLKPSDPGYPEGEISPAYATGEHEPAEAIDPGTIPT